jgi:single-stranded DNA-specific DHH superfamily exonuclease
MCEVMNDNGAKRFFNAMTDDKCKGYSFAKELEYLQSMNKLRKEITDKVYTTEQFKEFTKEHTTGNKVTDNIGVFVVPKESDIPHNLVGLIANRLSSNTDKSIIVLVQKQDGNYTGSGRGGSSVATSLYDFTKEIAQENNLTMEFGGHKQAIGISNLPQEELGTFLQAIENNLDRVQTISNEEKYTFPITEFLREDGLEMLAKFEPIGQGNRLPFVECEGKEICKNSGFKKSREDWKDVKFSLSIDGKTEKITSTDWSYSPDKYLNDDKGNISFTAELGTNTYRGETRLQLTSRFDRLQYIERAKELGKIEDKSSDKQSEKDDEHDEFDL